MPPRGRGRRRPSRPGGSSEGVNETDVPDELLASGEVAPQRFVDERGDRKRDRAVTDRHRRGQVHAIVAVHRQVVELRGKLEYIVAGERAGVYEDARGAHMGILNRFLVDALRVE